MTTRIEFTPATSEAEKNALVQEARRLSSLGYSVVPLAPKAKRPFLTKWQFGVSLDDVIAEIEKGRANGIGILTSAEVVMLDPDTDAELEWVLVNIPEARIAPRIFGRRGAKFLLRADRVVRFIKSVDFQLLALTSTGGGQLGVVPPTVHPDTGMPYTVTGSAIGPVSELPLLTRDSEFLLRERYARRKASDGDVSRAAWKRDKKRPTSADVVDMLKTIHDYLVALKGTGYFVPVRDGGFEFSVKNTSAWKQIVRAAMDCDGDLRQVRAELDRLSCLAGGTEAMREEVARVYNSRRNAEIVDAVLAPEDFHEEVGVTPITTATLKAAARVALRGLGKSVARQKHRRSFAAAAMIKRGVWSVKDMAVAAAVEIERSSKAGTYREFLSCINLALAEANGHRFALTAGAKEQLCKKFGIPKRALEKYIDKAKSVFAVVAGRYSADRTTYFSWYEPSGLGLVFIGKRGDIQCQVDRGVSNYSSTSQAEPEDGRSLALIHDAISEPSTHSRMSRNGLRQVTTASTFVYFTADIQGTLYLMRLALAQNEAPSEFYLDVVEKAVAPSVVEAAIFAIYEAKPKHALRHAKAASAELWHIVRSGVPVARVADVLGRAGRKVNWLIDKGHIQSNAHREVLKAWRKALERGAYEANLFTPGAVLVSKAEYGKELRRRKRDSRPE